MCVFLTNSDKFRFSFLQQRVCVTEEKQGDSLGTSTTCSWGGRGNWFDSAADQYALYRTAWRQIGAIINLKGVNERLTSVGASLQLVPAHIHWRWSFYQRGSETCLTPTNTQLISSHWCLHTDFYWFQWPLNSLSVKQHHQFSELNFLNETKITEHNKAQLEYVFNVPVTAG